MSPIGTKRTCWSQREMSVLGAKAGVPRAPAESPFDLISDMVSGKLSRARIVPAVIASIWSALDSFRPAPLNSSSVSLELCDAICETPISKLFEIGEKLGKWSKLNRGAKGEYAPMDPEFAADLRTPEDKTAPAHRFPHRWGRFNASLM